MAMNRTHSYEYAPRFDRILNTIRRGIDPERIRLVYNDAADELVVFLLPDVEHSVALDWDEHTYLLLDPVTEDVVGFQFDNFMSRAAVERPQLLVLAQLASVDPSLIERTRERIGEDRVRQAAVESALRDMLADTSVS